MSLSVLSLSLALFCVLTLGGAVCHADEFARTRRALIVCGLPGNQEFRQQFAESVSRIRSALTTRFDFEEANIRIQFGRSDEEPELEAFPSAGRATREEIAAEAKMLVQHTEDADIAWIFVIGHSFFDDRTVFLNIPDRDISHRQFSEMFEQLGGQSVFFICTPVSGYYIRYLSKPNRIVITSTEADVETNASIFHTALAKALTEIEPESSFDQDKNGVVSLLDLYIRVTQNLADLYLDNDPPLIPTEHPQLDDNGDGRGSELQIDYLTIAQGGRSDAKRRRNFRRFKDGQVAARIALELRSGTQSPGENAPN